MGTHPSARVYGIIRFITFWYCSRSEMMASRRARRGRNGENRVAKGV
uniref:BRASSINAZOLE-RESISTANT 1 protein n=1 Tax=Rhizophora mucronata TaxID=61149 RepID=A0A2P2JE56_RHIMU